MKMPAGVKIFFEQLIKKALIGMVGVKGWLAEKALRYGGQVLYDFVMNMYNKWQRKLKQDVAKVDHEKVVNDPNSKVDERGKAYEDRINAGRD